MTKRYVSKALHAQLTKLEECALHHYQIAARRRRGCENLPSWFSDKPAAYYDGMLQATYGAIEILLSGTYHGYSEKYPDCQLGKAITGDINGDGLHDYYYQVKPTAKQLAA